MCNIQHIFTYREVTGIVLNSFWGDEASDRKPRGTVWLVTLHDGVAPGHWHVINHPLVHVALVDALTKKLQLSFVILITFLVRLGAELFASSDVLSKLDLYEITALSE